MQTFSEGQIATLKAIIKETVQEALVNFHSQQDTMTTAQVMSYLNASRTSVWRMVKAGLLPQHTAPNTRKKVFYRKDVEKLVGNK